MIWVCLALIPIAFAVSQPTCRFMLGLGRRLGAHDTEALPGQIKAPRRPIPNTGGTGIYLGIALPILCAIIGVWVLNDERISAIIPAIGAHLEGIRARTPMGLAFLGSITLLHVLGLWDDRKPLGPWVKLILMCFPAVVMATAFDSRLLEFLDPYVGGTWLSVIVTVLWYLTVTNAMNFIDNMDGLAGGVTCIASACFLAAAIIGGQWFVAGTLALLVGACLGFLVFNAPPAKLFMGDGGSLVIGFTLAFLTVRTTYIGVDGGVASGAWYGLLMPVATLAIPLYDLVTVTFLRLRQGKSPMVGDMQHLSHRLVQRGLSKRNAVLIICGMTGVTGLAAIPLGSLAPWQAVLAGAQIMTTLLVLGLFEITTKRVVTKDGHADD